MLTNKLQSSLFTWQRWRAGGLLDLGILCNRKNVIIDNSYVIINSAVGYCDAENLTCRPKLKHKVVMYYFNGVHFWSHLTNYEFNKIARIK